MKNGFQIVGMGELLWDMLPAGRMLGGAPANFAYHSKMLGGSSMVVSAVGSDKLGAEAAQELQKKGVASMLSTSKYPTGTVDVAIKDGVPSYTISEPAAWDSIELGKNVQLALTKAQAFCFGTLAQRSAASQNAIVQAIALLPMDCLVVFDVNLRQNFYSQEVVVESLLNSNVLKISSEELAVVSAMLGLTGDEKSRCSALQESFGLLMVALTKGGEGSLLLMGKEESIGHAPAVDVVDTVGAGDAFTAALVDGVLKGLKLPEIHRRAVALSAYVCTQKGAMPPYSQKIADALK